MNASKQYAVKPEFDCSEAVQRLRLLRSQGIAATWVGPTPCGAPPVSNTGGRIPELDGSFEAAHIDTLTFSFPIDHLFDHGDPRDGDEPALAAIEDFLSIFDLECQAPSGRKLNGYQDSAPLLFSGVDARTNGKHQAGFVAWGGNRNKLQQETMCVHLTGHACEHLNVLDAANGLVWSRMVWLLEQLGAKITRVDVAYDDLTGDHGGIDAAVDWYKSGAFACKGRQPSVSNAGDWINGHSRTLYVGKRENGKLTRVYEKGHQLGDTESPWVRYELELHARDRVIPFDILKTPTAYIAGSCPAMEWVASVPPLSIMTVVKTKLRVTLDHLKGWASISYGKLINAMEGVGLTPDQIVDSLRRDGLPSRLFVPPAAVA